MTILEGPDAVLGLDHHRIALFTGAFDPIHHGHWDAVAKSLGVVDAVIIAPCPHHPRKEMSDLRHRTEMIRISCPEELGDRVFLGLPDIGISFPDTGYCRILPGLERKMTAQGQRMAILRGEDAFHKPYPSELAGLEHIVVGRKGDTAPLEEFVKGPLLYLGADWWHLSSSHLRTARRYSASGLHPGVAGYIREWCLYGQEGDITA